jgi:hypothetical protein
MPASSQPVILARKISPDGSARKQESICISGAWIPRNDDFRDSYKIPGICRWRGASLRRLGQDRRQQEEAAAMKFKVDIDCTPDEARAFFGLPDVKPLQEALLPEVEQRLRTILKGMDPEAMLKAWLPATLKGFEQLQQMFFANMPGASDKKK